MHPARELTKLGTGRAEPSADVSQRLAAVSEQLRHTGEPPLGTLAELALKAAALFVRRLHDPVPLENRIRR